MAEFKLYCFPQSGNAYKAGLCLNLVGADWEPIAVDYFGGETRTKEWRETVNEMGEVPVLEHRGQKLTSPASSSTTSPICSADSAAARRQSSARSGAGSFSTITSLRATSRRTAGCGPLPSLLAIPR